MFDWRPWALAAAVLLVLAAVGYNWFGRSSVDEQRRNLVALAFSAVLDSSAGEVFCLGEYNESRYEVFAGQPLAARMGIETVGVARADIKFRDGTVMTLTSAEGGSTRLWLRRLATLEPVGREVSAGKRVTLEAGTLEMHAAKQPEHEPLIVCTPHGEARVVGTKFRLVVTPDATRLEVREGSVKLSRRADGSSVVVAAMQFAATGPAAGMAAQPLPAVPAPQTPEAKQP
jgi:hypothetical protein